MREDHYRGGRNGLLSDDEKRSFTPQYIIYREDHYRGGRNGPLSNDEKRGQQRMSFTHQNNSYKKNNAWMANNIWIIAKHGRKTSQTAFIR